MRLDQLVARLGREFHLELMTEREAWGSLTYQPWLPKFASANFLETGNGLLVELPGNTEITHVGCAVFPNPDILERARAELPSGSVLFSHHAAGLKAPAGFLNLTAGHLRALREAGIAFYVLHAPLDVHERISTGRTLAALVEMEIRGVLAPYSFGYAGVFGRVPHAMVDDLVATLDRQLGVRSQVRPARSEPGLVAIVPGGADEAPILEEAASRGCQTYITGSVENPVTLDFVRAHNREFLAAAERLGMTLIGASHYATEMPAQWAMVDYFRGLGLTAMFLAGEPEDARYRW